MQEPMLLDIESGAEVLGVSRSTFYKLMDSGQIQTAHIGRRRLIARAELDRYVGQLQAESA